MPGDRRTTAHEWVYAFRCHFAKAVSRKPAQMECVNEGRLSERLRDVSDGSFVGDCRPNA